MLGELALSRDHGVHIVLVTGRILAELEAVFPDVADHVDAIVAENGAVLAMTNGARVRELVSAVDPALVDRLSEAGIQARQGLAIVACHGADEHAVVDELGRLGLECQLVHNRSELMVLPSGTNKGTGLGHALARLGYSLHDAVAVGDAENDHSLLDAAEVGVAVANAVASLKEHADVVLDEADGEGIVSLLRSVRAGDAPWRERSRLRLRLGTDDAGNPVELSTRPANVLIAGESGQGKSYLAGLVAEQLIDLDYSVVILDPEGDHAGLSRLRSAIVVGGDLPPAPTEVVMSLLDRNDASIVIDLSSLDVGERDHYLRCFPAEIEASRRASGRPHWVLVDEAHDTVASNEAALGVFEPSGKGYCFVTWRPGTLSRVALAALDVVLAMTSPTPDDTLVDIAAAVSARPKAEIARLLSGPGGSVLVAERGALTAPRVARVEQRSTTHFRHVHKYDTVGTPDHRRFVFRAVPDHRTGAVAINPGELEVELASCERAVLRHHAPRRDFSRWIAEVFHDDSLSAAIRAAEMTIDTESPSALVESARLAMINALRARLKR